MGEKGSRVGGDELKTNNLKSSVYTPLSFPNYMCKSWQLHVNLQKLKGIVVQRLNPILPNLTQYVSGCTPLEKEQN